MMLQTDLISRRQWNQIIELNYRAVAAQYGHRFIQHPYVRETMGMDGADSYAERRKHPQKETSLYSYSRLHFEIDNDTVVAVAWTARETSGKTEQERRYKMEAESAERRWLWFGWVATHPKYQNQGLATKLIRQAIEVAEPEQPASAFVWPNPTSVRNPIYGPLAANGFKAVQDPAIMPDLSVEAVDMADIPTQRFIRRP